MAQPAVRVGRRKSAPPLNFTLAMLKISRIVLLGICTCGALYQNAGAADQASAHVSSETLDRLRDCSMRLWYDQDRRALVGEGADILVPKGALVKIKERHATISITATLHEIPATQLFVPTYSFESVNGSDQIQLRMSSNIETLKSKLQSAWNLEFVRGEPEGPDPDPNEITYYSRDIAFLPYLSAATRSARVSWLSCATRPQR
jgi:hypothetical protein